MITLRLAEDRGHANHGWLDTFHSFSFAGYYDPAHMGFRGLRVINEDRVQPGRGFGTHPHDNMEIVTYVLEGSLQHRDSMGNGSVIHPGEVQRMSAGTGITHSEANASESEVVHLLQIWIVPQRRGITPSYEQKAFGRELLEGRLQLVASADGSRGSVTVHADALLHIGVFAGGQSAELPLRPNRHAWVQLARGKASVNDQTLKAGDGAALSEVSAVQIAGIDNAEVLVFDLA